MRADLQEHTDRLQWVQDEIDRLDEEVQAYLETKPCEVRWHYDFSKNPPTRLYYPVEVSPPPKGVQIRTGTLINELRSILDALACTLAARNGASQAAIKETYFPTAQSAADYQSDPRIRRKIKHLFPADQLLIDNLRPYRGGNDLLFTLHSADVLRKHQRLVLFANSLENIVVLPGIIDGARLGRIGFEPGPVSRRPIIAEQPHDYHQPLDVSVTVTFAEPPWIEGKPISATLRDFACEVKSALEVFH